MSPISIAGKPIGFSGAEAPGKAHPSVTWREIDWAGFASQPSNCPTMGIHGNRKVTVVIYEPQALMADGNRIGRAYEMEDFLHFWLARTNEDSAEWETKKTIIERTVPYFGSRMPLSTRRLYAVPIILPKDSKPPARYTIDIVVNGSLKSFEILP